MSPELKNDGIQLYQELIGVLRWAVELGRVDILLEVSLMSTYMAMPREGHVQQLYRMFYALPQEEARIQFPASRNK